MTGQRTAAHAVMKEQKANAPAVPRPRNAALKAAVAATHPVRVKALVIEELRAIPRNAFGLAALAAILTFYAPLGALAFGGEGGIEDTLIFTWLVGELVVAIIVAARVASVRKTRFVDSIYTTPLQQTTWLAAQAMVGGVLALFVLVIQLPFLLVHMIWLGMPAALPTLFVAALAMAAFAVALGLFAGVIVGESSPITAAGIAGGFGFISFAAFIVHGIMTMSPPTAVQQLVLRLTSISPLALVMSGFHINVFGIVPADRWRPFVGLAGLITGLSGAAWVGYTRAQTPLGWDARGSRTIVAALIAVAVVTPIATAELTFVGQDDEGPAFYEPGEHTQVALVARGAPLHDESFTLSEVWDSPALPYDKPVEADALVLALVPANATIRDVRIQIKGTDSVRVESGGVLNVADGKPMGRAPPGSGWETTANTPPRPVYRVPVTLRAISLSALGESPAVVEVHTQFRVEAEVLTSVGIVTLDAEIDGAFLQLFGAGLIIPASTFTALGVRKRRTR